MGLENFAKTEYGRAFFGLFANKGDKIGSVEFTETGEYANHELYFTELKDGNVEGNTPPPINRFVYGPMQGGKTNNYIEFFLQVDIRMDNIAINMAETIGYEVFLHLSQYLDDYIKSFEANDLEGAQAILNKHSNGNPSGARDHLSQYYKTIKANQYYTFINQLKTILNPIEVQKQVDIDKVKL